MGGARLSGVQRLLTIDGLHPAAFQVVIAAVEHLPRLEHFVKVPRHCVLNQVVSPASALRGQVFEFLFRLAGEVYFHGLQGTGKTSPAANAGWTPYETRHFGNAAGITASKPGVRKKP